MDVKGLLIGVRRYQFTDKETGELVSGAKVSLGIKPEDNNAAGYVVQDIPAPFEAFAVLANAAKDLAGQVVSVSCEVSLKGRYTKLRAADIQAA